MLKFQLYQDAVQDPASDVKLYSNIYTQTHQKLGLGSNKVKTPKKSIPLNIREDFCGTHSFSCEWVKLSPEHTAIGLDIDEPTLQAGVKLNQKQLTPEQKSRLSILNQSVLKPTTKKSDLIVANNFSFFCLKQKKDVISYFRSAKASLKKNGCFVVEIAGGGQFLEKCLEQKTKRHPTLGKYTYYWHQKEYNPINGEGLYAIHFKLENSKKPSKPPKHIHDAFVYDWRLWTIPEAREMMSIAGFKKTVVFWDKRSRHVYTPTESAKYETFWIAYLVGIQS